jgi:general secretion pathway protein L
MNPEFYLFIPERQSYEDELESVTLSWVYEDINNELKLVQGSLSDAAAASQNHYVTVVLAGEDVLFLNANIPGKNSQHIQQAVPYVLEDSVIDDVDDLYFAVKQSDKINSDNLYDVSVINKHYFKSVINQLENAGIYADSMIADYLLLKGENAVFVTEDRMLFNSADLKFSSAIESSAEIVNNLEAEDEVVRLIYCNHDTDENNNVDKLFAKVELNKEVCDIQPLLCLIKNSSRKSAINLLQGSYKKKKNWSKTTKTWMPVAALFLVWVSLQSGIFLFDYVSLSKQSKILNIEITKIYKKTFPGERRVVDAKARMQSKLASLKKRSGLSGASFTDILAGSAGIFSKTNGLNIKSLRYHDGRLNLELQIASLQALDKLKNQLIQEKGYQVEIQNASSGNKMVTARIQIIGAEL